ncbi:hypothetical protein FSP39_025409 [Pinctada imbricata]|uniref:Uncharacterized protein n=1 Tax=Pinctada imbricata TaxID=66713 RepID=A0AA89C5Y6_PINIB|nr:hypothetical protein FSP39_025409 [Pinctada imbricata]
MRDSGYAGHVYINRRLTLYVSKSAKGVTKDALIEAAEELFDDVKCEYVWKTNTIKSCTLQHGEKCENVSQRRGTLGTFAKNCTGNLYALTVPHFVKEGDIVYRDTIEIGTCIWPRMDQGMSLMNEIAVVNIRKQFEENCTLIHETLSGEAQHFGLYTQNPRVYSQVFKGRQNTGFMTGRIVSSEARLPYKDGPLQAYLIEGDDQTPFIIGGDSGDVVKLVREENGELKGVSVIFGEALELPGIERGTCITIPLRAAVNRFEACYGTNLTFR